MRTNDVWGRLRGLSHEYDALYDLRWGALQLRFHLNSQNGPALLHLLHLLQHVNPREDLVRPSNYCLHL